MSEAAITSKGQITIPAEVRKRMRIRAKDRVVFTVMADGTTVMRAKTRTLRDLAGVLSGVRKVKARSMRIGRK
ncbi:MAG: AbrB/MazE/SpoVT family DNA-binding domain-containing protein [Myxococcaceae bacterium]